MNVGGVALDVVGVGGHSLLVSAGVSSLNVAGLDVLTLTSDVVVPFWVVDDLGFNWQVLNSFPDSFDWFVFNDGFFDFLGNVFNLSFNGIVIGDGSFDGDSFGSGDFLILYDFSFVWDSFDSFDLIVLNVLLFERNVLDSGFDWNLFGDNLLGEALTDSGVSSGAGLEGLVDELVVLGD